MGYLQALLIAIPLLSPTVAADLVCGAAGIALKLPYYTNTSKTLTTAAACGTHCKGDSKCLSYAVTTGFCFHYTTPVGQAFTASSLSPILFYDRICAPIVLTPPSSTSGASAGNTAGSTATIDMGGVVTTPNIQTTDSPPLSSSQVVFPTGDKSFTVTYTYEDDPLPTIAAMGSAPLAQGLPAPTAGLPDLPCMLDPSLTTNQFNLLGSNFVPLVSQAGNRLQPLPSPTSEAAAKALGPADQLALPAFFFQKSATAGVYDIVLAGNTPQYIAKTSNGGLVLTGSSTGNKATLRNGQNIITSIFGVDCKGRITVTQAGQLYIWDISGSTTAFTAGTSNKTMVVYSLQRKSTTRKVRRSIYTEGSAPRCPNTPPALSAKVFPGARGLNPNGCGPANGFDFVPDFSFGSCCDKHDNCYDNCEAGTFEGCNNDFHTCMRTDGCNYLDHWYSYVPYLACLKAADFYAWAVGTSIGRSAFYSANKERCGCYCSASQGLCGRSAINTGDQAPDPINYVCANMFGSDVTNCGACGRTCSAKAKCNKGSCACPNDQCGSRCVNLLTHPSNCGSCGNKCDTGYCFQGQCYAPPPDKCAPVEGFANGDFSQHGTGWSTSSNGMSIDFADPQAYFAGSGSGEISTTVKMCPELKYEVSFSLRRSALTGACKFKYQFGSRGWSGQYDFSGDSDKHELGPFDVQAFSSGDSGTTANGLSLDVNFVGHVDCSATAWVVVDDLSLAPAQ